MTSTSKTQIAVIGGGPAGLMAAEAGAGRRRGDGLRPRCPRLGRKFLMAGRGGLTSRIAKCSRRFSRATAKRAAARTGDRGVPAGRCAQWSEALGQPTFVGSSGRVFPEGDESLAAAARVAAATGCDGVQFRLRHRWTGWDERWALVFETPDGSRTSIADATVLALGGASWPRLGSDGGWRNVRAKVEISPLRPANCGFAVAWTDIFRERFAGQPLKRIALSPAADTVRGEAVITRYGIEGGAIYALSRKLREAHRKIRRGDAVHRSASRPIDEAIGVDRSAAARQAIALDLPAQGRASVAAGDRAVAGSGRVRRETGSLSAEELAA